MKGGTVRLLHLSDLHVGKRVNEFPMLEDQRFVLEEVVRIVEERAVDAVLIAGDLYDKALPAPAAVALVDWFLDALAQTGAQTFVVPGNHDAPERVAYARRPLDRQGIHIAPPWDGTVTSHVLEDEHGPVTFWLIPFLKPVHVRPYYPDEQIASYTDALRRVVASCDVRPDVRNVALSHQFVTAAGSPTERTDSELSLGGIDDVDVSVYDPFDYVALGHVHRPQRVGRDAVRYSGSPLKYSFSEIPGTKSAPLVELGAPGSAPAVELVTLPALHDMRCIRGPLAELTDPATVAAADPADYLRVVLTDEEPPLDAIGKLRTVYPNVMGVEFDNARTRAAGVDGPAPADARDRDPIELFSDFYKQQNGRGLSPSQLVVLREVFEEAQVM
jgi:exonuclease SbcD